jgi:hypothetical protein
MPAAQFVTPYQRDIARATRVLDPADLEAIEDAMRVAHPSLDGLSAREFAEEARVGWVTVRGMRVMDAAGIGPEHPGFLDPALHCAAAIYVHQGLTGPLTRPLTFYAAEQDHGEGPEWVTYAIPAAAWRADMPRAQASTFDTGCAVPHGAAGYEAICRRCGVVFNPDLFHADRSGLQHKAGDFGPCGGAADVVNWWG